MLPILRQHILSGPVERNAVQLQVGEDISTRIVLLQCLDDIERVVQRTEAHAELTQLGRQIRLWSSEMIWGDVRTFTGEVVFDVGRHNRCPPMLG